MDLHKLAHDACEATKYWYMPLLAGLIGYIRIIKEKDKISDLGDVPGDNILSKEILNSLISRRSL